MLPFPFFNPMQSDRPFSRPLLAGLVVVVAAVAVLFWFVTAPDVGDPAPAPATAQAAQKKGAATPAAASDSASAASVTAARMSGGAGGNVPADHAVGTILAENPTVEGARAVLLEKFPTFSDAEKVAAAPHLVNLVQDEGLVALVNVLHDPRTPLEAKEIVFDNMLNRPPALGWPVLLQVLGTPGHPLAQKARETLTIVVGANHEDRLQDWQNALNAQLQLQGQRTE